MSHYTAAFSGNGSYALLSDAVSSAIQPLMAAQPPSPSKNPCMVRIKGATSRYRNDPYNCRVLPPLQHITVPAAPSAPLPDVVFPRAFAAPTTQSMITESSLPAVANPQQQHSNQYQHQQQYATPLPPPQPQHHNSSFVRPTGPAPSVPFPVFSSSMGYHGNVGISPAVVPASKPATKAAQPTTVVGRRAHKVKAEVARAAEQYACPEKEEPWSDSDDDTAAMEEGLAATVSEKHSEGDDGAGGNSTTDKCFAAVSFKHSHFPCNYVSAFDVFPGETVVVEGDRGINVGTVVHTMTAPPPHSVPLRILRKALPHDVYIARMQREREVGAVKLAIEHVQHFSEMRGFRVVDCEFQADGNKLTIYFSARRVVDFRRLQRALFQVYRCRIWLVNWNDLQKAPAASE